jgi:hypothetical protein
MARALSIGIESTLTSTQENFPRDRNRSESFFVLKSLVPVKNSQDTRARGGAHLPSKSIPEGNIPFRS